MIWRQFFSRLAGIASSGFLVRLCLPSGPWPWLPFLALVPFALTLRNTGPLAGMFWGLAGGSLFWMVSTFWVFHSFQHLMGWSVSLSILGILVFALVQGLPYAFFGFICGVLRTWELPVGAFSQAFLLTLLVFILPVPCPGSFALSLYSQPLAIQTADLGGYALVSFFILLINWLLADALASVNQTKRCLFYLGTTGLILTLFLGYGGFRLNHFQRLEQNALQDEFFTVRTIQPNIPVTGLVGHELEGKYRDSLGIMQMMTETTVPDLPPTDLIVWPEVSRAIYCGCNFFEDRGVDQTSQMADSPIVLACLENPRLNTRQPGDGQDGVHSLPQIREHEQYTVYNTLMMIDGSQCRIVYRKHKLVPFGEAAPLRQKWPWLYHKMARQMEYAPGPGPEVFLLSNNLEIQPLICFESGFPEMTRAGVGLGAQAFINLSNDAWFMSARAAELHLALALFRAVEQRRPLVRATNSGSGAHIKASGEIVKGSLTPMNERAVRQAELHIPDGITIYQRIGDVWLWLAGLSVLGRIGLGLRVRPSCRRATSQSDAAP